MKKNLMKVIPTPELLQEMDELQICGGDGGDINVHAVVNCHVETNTFCSGANCVPQCGCTVEPGLPVTHKVEGCGSNGGNSGWMVF